MKEIRTERPASRRQKMNIPDRAKQFAPFESLGSMDDVLGAIEAAFDTGDPEHVADLEDFNGYTEFAADDLSAENLNIEL